jgi:hypothetical protein
MDKLKYWDRNAPLPEEPQQIIGWNDARDTVLTAYGDFSPRMAEIAGRFFDDGWIDAPVPRGQAAGRVLASHRAERAPVRTLELSGQAAGRDDACS